MIGNKNLMISIQKSDNEVIKVVLDDLVREGEKNFSKDTLYTFKEYDLSVFENLEFDEKELADFGYSIMARLHAYYKTAKPNGS